MIYLFFLLYSKNVSTGFSVNGFIFTSQPINQSDELYVLGMVLRRAIGYLWIIVDHLEMSQTFSPKSRRLFIA